MSIRKSWSSLLILFATTLPALADDPTTAITDAQVAAVAESPASDPWTGVWGALIAGNGRSTVDVNTDISSPENPGASLAIDVPGFGGSGSLAGVEVGYGRRFGDRFAWGIQLGHSAADVNAGVEYLPEGGPFIIGYQFRARSMTSLLGRMGYLVNDNSMVFALAGVSRAQFDGSFALTGDGISLGGDYDFALTGLTLGAGFEKMVTDRIALRLDYRITKFSDHDLVDTLLPGVDLQTNLQTGVQSLNAAVVLRF